MKKGKQLGSTGLAIILIVLFVIQPGGAAQVSAVNDSENHKTSKASEMQVKAEMNNTSNEDISHQQIVYLTEEFMNILVQDIDKQYKVIQFDTKNELLNAFKDIAAKDVATKYTDYYFQEEKDGLYIRPTETPPWFIPKNDYDMIQKDGKHVEVVQNNKTDLYGSYTMKIEFTYNKQWRITNIAYE